MKNCSIIINADDCGLNEHVNKEIERFINAGKISSTTVMANMHDLEGAVRLYGKYGDKISFGWHMNLTEGEPLLKNQLLLDNGYYKEKDGRVVFNGLSFRFKQVPRYMFPEIKKELIAQYEKIKDSGIIITHADSHHHIHTTKGFVGFFPGFLKEIGIGKCRRMRNYMDFSMSYCARQAWAMWFRLHGLKMPDCFCEFQEYHDKPNTRNWKSLEIMVHPGHPSEAYTKEALLLDEDFDKLFSTAKLINYKEI